MAKPELVLHVGMQQTGARMLHRALRRLRPQLLRHGIGLIGPAAVEQLSGVGGWRNHDAVDEAAVAAFERGLAGLVAEETAAVRRAGAAARAMVLSTDHLLGRDNIDACDERLFRPFAVPSIAQVIRAVGPPSARLVLYVRRQDRLMEACYLRALQNGGTHRFDQQFPRRFEPVLDYDELVERLERIPEVADVRVRPFELVGSSALALVHDLVSALGLAGRLDLTDVDGDLVPYRLYSRRAAGIAVDVNPYLDSPRERRLVRKFLTEQFPGTDDASTRLLPAADRRQIVEAYAAANRGLFERRMPDLAADAYEREEATAELFGAARTVTDLSPGGDVRRPAGACSPSTGAPLGRGRLRGWAARAGGTLCSIPAWSRGWLYRRWAAVPTRPGGEESSPRSDDMGLTQRGRRGSRKPGGTGIFNVPGRR